MKTCALAVILVYAVCSTSGYTIRELGGERQARSYDDCEKAKQEAEAQNTDPCITFKCSGGMLQQRMQMCPSDESLYAKCPEPSQTPQECCKSCKCIDHDGVSHNDGDTFVYGTSSATFDCECKNGEATCKKRDSGNKLPVTPTPTWPDWGDWEWDSPN